MIANQLFPVNIVFLIALTLILMEALRCLFVYWNIVTLSTMEYIKMRVDSA